VINTPVNALYEELHDMLLNFAILSYICLTFIAEIVPPSAVGVNVSAAKPLRTFSLLIAFCNSTNTSFSITLPVVPKVVVHIVLLVVQMVPIFILFQ
jgi:hypothetical protein